MIKKLFILIIISLIIESCANKKDILYYQDVVENSTTTINYYPSPIQVNDILFIKVSAMIPETVEPFNIQGVSSSNSSISVYKLQGYTVTIEGTISFPILGTIKVLGLTITDVQEKISKLLTEKGFVKEPTVNVRVINNKFTVLGEVSYPGTFSYDEQTLSLNQAIGLAGGLTMYGIRKNVLLIREINGTRTFIKLDLTSSDWFNGPYYYVKQNDVIVVNPNGPKVLTSGYITGIGSVIGLVSFGISLFLLLKK